MEIHAYCDLYVDDAMDSLGDLFDLAIRQESLDPQEFSEMFVNSDVCRLLQDGNLRLLGGISAQETLSVILNRKVVQKVPIEYGAEYWAGYVLAYVHWRSGIPFGRIFKDVPLERVLSMYHLLHEADVTKTYEWITGEISLENALLAQRRRSGLTQEEVASRSGVSLRSIRAYEQGQVDIGSARADVVYLLARTLGCTMEELVRAPAYKV